MQRFSKSTVGDMGWSADFDKKAERDIARLPKVVRIRVLARISWLVENFDSIVPAPLHEELRGQYKLRSGDYRAVYRIDYEKRVLRIDYVDNRSRVYKRKRK